MNKKTTLGILFGAVAFSWVTLSSGAGVYRWVDEKGVTHYGEKPPAPGVGEKIKVSAPGPSSTPAPAAKTAANQTTPGNAAATGAESAAANAQTEVMKKNCEAYAANLRVLKEHGRIREQGNDGQVKMLTDEEKQSRIQQAEKFIAENCQGAKK